jgi:aspartyl-tRNA(Asn)/glutamyl-tRNA(Gln) amidotransferase subunit A
VSADDLVWASMVELAARVRRRDVSAVAVTQAHLDRIASLDDRLRAFITVMADDALSSAREVDAAIAAGRAVGPLAGVPVGLKDLCQTKGVRTTAGSRLLADFVPDTDATVVTRLRAAGAIVLGKLNMHEFAYGPEGLNIHYGHSWNPWDAATHRMCGGSSSGSAAAVAAGLCAGAIGSDTGGSIRIPAALTGLSGIKPTYGRVSRSGALPLSWSLDHVGPMCRSAADCALMLGAIAGHDAADASSSRQAVPDYPGALTGDIRGLRVGMLRPYFLEFADAEVRTAVEAAVESLLGLGATVTDVNIPHVPLSMGATSPVIGAEAYAYHEKWLKTRWTDYGPDVRERLAVGAFVSGADYVNGQRTRAMIRHDVNAALSRCDVLIAPSTPVAAPEIGAETVSVNGETHPVRGALLRFTRPFNATGHPAASIPCGFTDNGLPIGLQLVGRAFDEATVLRVADAYQRVTDWHRRRPAPMI